MIYKPSKLVVPELAYNKLVPNKIKHELNPPNKKYIKPPVVDNSEFLYIVLNIYNSFTFLIYIITLKTTG